MAAKRKETGRSDTRAAGAMTVAGFFAALDDPLKATLKAVCQAIGGASPAIREGIKWNAPSYFVGEEEYFATANIHTRGKHPPAVLVVLHRGAKAKPGRVTVSDPEHLVEWMGPDRGVVRFGGLAEARAKRAAFQALVREWVTQVPTR